MQPTLPCRSFTREEWKKLEEHPMFPITGIDLTKLQAMNEPLTMGGRWRISTSPLVRLLQIHIAHYRNLHDERDRFFQNASKPIPYIIGIAGSVAAGKSTTARVLPEALVDDSRSAPCRTDYHRWLLVF